MILAGVVDTIQLVVAIAGLVSGAAAAVGVFLLRNQIHQTERQSLSNSSRFCYEEMSALLGVLIEHPELRPFIYENKACPSDGALRQQVLALAGRYADFFEAILAQVALGSLSTNEYEGMWKAFVRRIISDSAVLREYVLEHPDYYSADIRQLATGG